MTSPRMEGEQAKTRLWTGCWYLHGVNEEANRGGDLSVG